MANINIDITELQAEFGAYYLGANNQANRTRLFHRLYVMSETDKLFTRITTTATIYQAAQVLFDRIMQTFTCDWTPKTNVLEIKPISIPLQHLKFDIDICPYDIQESWAGFLAGENLQPEAFPLIAYIIEEILLKTWEEEWELYAVYKGVYDITPLPNTSSDVIDGIRKQINDGITATTITPVVLGALPADDKLLVRYVEEFTDALPIQYRQMKDTLMMSYENSLRYMRGMDELYNMNYAKETNLYNVAKTNISVVGLPSMSGSDKLILTPKENRILLEKDARNVQNIRVETAKRQVSIFTDYWKGIGFNRHDILFTNDLDLV